MHLRYDEFIGQVQHRAGLGSHAEAERATRATLETLAERLAGGEAHDLASQLSPELTRSLEAPDAGIGAKLTLDEFFELVSEREGDPTYNFYVILSGVVEVAVHSDGEERIINRQGPGRFLGELNLLTGERVYLSAHIVEPGEVLVVPRAALQHVIATNPGLGDTI